MYKRLNYHANRQWQHVLLKFCLWTCSLHNTGTKAKYWTWYVIFDFHVFSTREFNYSSDLRSSWIKERKKENIIQNAKRQSMEMVLMCPNEWWYLVDFFRWGKGALKAIMLSLRNTVLLNNWKNFNWVLWGMLNEDISKTIHFFIMYN